MTKLQKPNPTVSEILDEFFTQAEIDAKPAALRRIRLVRAHFEEYLDCCGWRSLTTPELQVLHNEQQSSPAGAFARTMGAEALFFTLQHYLEPQHRLFSGLDEKCQVRLTGELGQALAERAAREEWGDLSCAILDLEGALRGARRRY